MQLIDGGKTDWSLLPMHLIDGVKQIETYSRCNWLMGIKQIDAYWKLISQRVFHSVLIRSMNKENDNDKETKDY